MNVNQELEAFREANSGCDVAALIDLSTRMVLSSSVATRMPQEELDALATSARDVLLGPMAEAALSVDGEEAPEALQGLLATEAETRAFVRSAADRNEALVCVCSLDADLEQVLKSGRDALTSILAGA